MSNIGSNMATTSVMTAVPSVTAVVARKTYQIVPQSEPETYVVCEDGCRLESTSCVAESTPASSSSASTSDYSEKDDEEEDDNDSEYEYGKLASTTFIAIESRR